MESKKNFNAVIVVEGKDDTIRLNQFFPGVETVETNGSAVSKQMLANLQKLAQTRDIIVLTDPDYNGERIRRLVTEAVPNAKQAFITRKEGAPHKKGSLGVEHASKEALTRALKDLHEVTRESNLTWEQFIDLGLAFGADASHLREQIGIKLSIGYGNAKQFFKRLTMYGVDFDTLTAAIKEIKHG